MIPCSETWFYWFFKRLPIFQFSVALGTCSRNRLHNIGISSVLKWSIANVSLRWGTFLLLKPWFSTYSWVWLNLEFVLPASIYWTPGVYLAPSHEKAGFLTSRSGSKNSTLVVGIFQHNWVPSNPLVLTICMWQHRSEKESTGFTRVPKGPAWHKNDSELPRGAHKQDSNRIVGLTRKMITRCRKVPQGSEKS